MHGSPTRRRLLQAGAVAGATALAGCFDGGGDESAVSAATPLSVVPSGTRFVVGADVTALLDDDALRSSLAALLGDQQGSTGPMPVTGLTSLEDVLDRVEASVGLDPRAVSSAVGFGTYEAGSQAGLVVWADWSTDDLSQAMADAGSEPRTETYADRDLLVAEDATIAELAPGTYAVGLRPTVEQVVDVATERAAAVEGPVASGFDATDGAALRLAFEVPADAGEGSTTAGGLDPALVESITHGYGAYDIDGNDRRTSLTLETDSDAAAGRLQSRLETLRQEARQQLAATAGRPMIAELRALLDAMTISQSGASVTVAATDAAVVPLVLLAVLSSFVLEVGSDPSPVVPRASFAFDYDVDASVVTITHEAGDSIAAEQLSVRGEGLAAAADADMHGPGFWAGSNSGEVGGKPAVVAGDSVSVGVAGPDYEVRVVWQSADGSTTATLASDRGPEA